MAGVNVYRLPDSDIASLARKDFQFHPERVESGNGKQHLCVCKFAHVHVALDHGAIEGGFHCVGLKAVAGLDSGQYVAGFDVITEPGTNVRDLTREPCAYLSDPVGIRNQSAIAGDDAL